MKIWNFYLLSTIKGVSILVLLTLSAAYQVAAQNDCPGLSAGVVTVNETEACYGKTVQLSVSGHSESTFGLYRSWQYSQAGENNWQNTGSFANQKWELITEDLDFRFYVECENGDKDSSNVVSVTLKPAPGCYCTTENVSAAYLRYLNLNSSVDNKSHENINKNFSADVPGYLNLTDNLILESLPGDTVDVDIIHSSGAHRTIAWVDWGNYGRFENNDLVGNKYVSSASNSFSFVIPPDASGDFRLRIRGGAGSTQFNACNSIEGSTIDVTLRVVDLEPCSNATAGVIEVSRNEVCPNTKVKLTVTDHSDLAEGLSRSWQSSPAGENNWTDLENGFEYVETEVTAPTDFRYVVNCDDGTDDISNIVSVAIKPELKCYCVPPYTYPYYSGTFIRGVGTSNAIEDFANSENGMTLEGYNDYSEAFVVTTKPGSTFEIHAQYPGNHTSTNFTAWIDWNQNGSFEDEGEKIEFTDFILTLSPRRKIAYVTVPDDAVPGNTQMRIRSHLNSLSNIITACEDIPQTETEDYGVEILPLEPCVTSVAGTISSNLTAVCPGFNIKLSVSGHSNAADGLLRTWQYALPGENNWINMNLTDSSITVEMNEAKDFRYYVECDEVGIGSNIISLNVKPENLCYCIPAPYAGDARWIYEVSTTDAIVDFSNVGLDNSSKYIDYSHSHAATVKPGESFQVLVKSAESWSTGIKIWFDWNQNGSFDDEGEVYTPSSYTGSYEGDIFMYKNTFVISVPEDATPGITGMRVRSYAQNISSSCENLNQSVTQDYALDIIALEPCDAISAGTISVDHYSVCFGDTVTLEVAGNSVPHAGLYRTWQSSPAGENNWTSLNSNSPTIQVPITTPTDFRFFTDCANIGSDVSNIISVDVTHYDNCYCIPPEESYPFIATPLKSFLSLESSVQSIAHQITTLLYEYLDDNKIFYITPEDSVTFTGKAYNLDEVYSVKIWVDWNKDGFFDNEEVVGTKGGVSTGAPVKIKFETPSDISGDYRMRIRITRGGSINGNSTSACGFLHHSSSVDFKVRVFSPCIDFNAGTVELANSDEICPEDEVALVVSGHSNYIGTNGSWQSSPPGENNWTDLNINTDTLHTIVASPTDFRYYTTCSGAGEDSSNVVFVNPILTTDCYCAVTSTNTQYGIANFTTLGGIENINNTSGSGQYTDYTDQYVSAIAGSSILFKLTPVYSLGGNGYGIWIDWNGNGSFADAGEHVFNSNAYISNPQVNINIPSDIDPGDYRIRIVSNWFNTSPPPCGDLGNLNYGEAEDYTLRIIESEPCTEPVVGTVMLNGNESICEGETIELSVSGNYQVGGLIRKWQSSPSGANNWMDMEQESTIIQVSPSQSTDYRYFVVCEYTGANISNVVSVEITPSSECYCEVITANYLYGITEFKTLGGIVNIDNPSGSKTYSNYTDQYVMAEAGSTVDFTIKGATIGQGFGVWIDWNQNGSFSDPGEHVMDVESPATNPSASITVPIDVAPGNYRIRVVSTKFSGSPTPCGNLGHTASGEAEDYTFKVVSLEPCVEANAGVVTIDEENGYCFGNTVYLSVIGNSEPAIGLFRTWQSSPKGENTWSDLNTTGASQIAVEITDNTDFRYYVSCEDGSSHISNVVSANVLTSPNCYCEVTSNNVLSGIGNFKTSGGIENIDNSSGPSSYSNFTEHYVLVQAGDTIDFSISGVPPYYYQGYSVWVDWNRNGSFDDPGENIYSSGMYLINAAGIIPIPEGQASGNYRMRIVANRASYYPSPCGDLGNELYGEAEDYTIHVLEQMNVCTEVVGGMISSVQNEVCEGSEVHITASGYTVGTAGLTYNWQSSPAGQNDWSNINISTSWLDTEVYEPTDFRYYVHCENGNSGSSNIISIGIKTPINCYCELPSLPSAYGIGYFHTSGGIENIDNSSGAAVYSNYSNQYVSAMAGEVINFVVEGTGSTMTFGIWIDWNKDGIFDDEDELIYHSTNYLYTATGNIEVPPNTPPGEYRIRVAGNFIASTLSPCGNELHIMSGEIEDYTFRVIEPESCTNVIAGIITAKSNEVCPDEEATLWVAGHSDYTNGLTKYWQSSPAGENNWTNLTNGSHTLHMEINQPTDFRFFTSCEDGSADTSNVVSISIKLPAACLYCEVTTSNYGYGIANFSTYGGIENINNSSGPGAYSDFTDQFISITADEWFSFSINSVFPTNKYGIWIDWNQNGSFDDPGDWVYHQSEYSLDVNGEIYVPAGIAPGDYRIRVVSNWSTDIITPCGNLGISPTNQQVAEAEDYTLRIVETDICNSAIAGIITANLTEVCAGKSVALSVSGHSSPTSGLVRTWQSSPAGENNWTDLENSLQTSNFEINQATDFRYFVECENGYTDVSNVISIELKTSIDCDYCEVTSLNSIYGIGNFSTFGGFENIDNSSGPGTYTDYTDQYVSAAPGSTVDISITSFVTTLSFRVWIDWNQNGVFEPHEMVYSSITYLHLAQGVIYVPADVEPGEYRMRVVGHYTDTSPEPCGDLTSLSSNAAKEFGEAEDYTFRIIDYSPCNGEPSAGIIAASAEEICPGNLISLSVSDHSDVAIGLMRSWQSSPVGENNWTNLNNSFYTIDIEVNQSTDYRYFIQCENGGADSSNVITVVTNPIDECYCSPTSGSDNYISSITLETTTNTVYYTATEQPVNPVKGYDDLYNSLSFDVMPGEVINITTEYFEGSNGIKVWVDWDNNQNFTLAELMDERYIYEYSFITSNELSFEVPEDAYGEYRMRIRGQSSPANVGACSETAHGSTVDIKLNVYTTCINPVAGTITTNSYEVCADSTVTLSVSENTTLADGLIKNWQSSPAEENDWTNLGSDLASIVVGITQPTDFRYYVECGNESDFSNIITIDLKSANECHCIPEYNFSGFYLNTYISSFYAAGAIQDVQYENIESGIHHDQKSLVVETFPGQTIYLSTFVEDIEMMRTVGIWVDWDQDGVFYGSEEQLYLNYGISPQTFFYTIPTNAQNGSYVLRVRGALGEHTAEGDDFSCSIKDLGSSVDFTIKIIDNPDGGTQDPNPPFVALQASHLLDTAPNPSSGPTMVWLTTNETTRAVLEVFDINGRVISTLFDQVAQEGMEYQFHFDGSSLPNGVYIYRLTTHSGVVIKKFMIAK